MELRHQINHEIYKAFERLGADAELLSVIGSYGDTLPDEDILESLKLINAGKPVITEVFCEVVHQKQRIVCLN